MCTNTPWSAFADIIAWQTWVSPQRATENSALVLISDMNDWSESGAATFVPHGKNGPRLNGVDPANQGAHQSPDKLGATGGNVGLLDGSVSWRKIKQMRCYSACQLSSFECAAMW